MNIGFQIYVFLCVLCKMYFVSCAENKAVQSILAQGNGMSPTPCQSVVWARAIAFKYF